MEYLGYVITESGIKMDPIKISIIKGWPTPRNISEVQLFLEFINFYRRFIKKYFEVAITVNRDVRRSDDSDKGEAVRQQDIIKY